MIRYSYISLIYDENVIFKLLECTNNVEKDNDSEVDDNGNDLFYDCNWYDDVDDDIDWDIAEMFSYTDYNEMYLIFICIL